MLTKHKVRTITDQSVRVLIKHSRCVSDRATVLTGSNRLACPVGSRSQLLNCIPTIRHDLGRRVHSSDWRTCRVFQNNISKNSWMKDKSRAEIFRSENRRRNQKNSLIRMPATRFRHFTCRRHNLRHHINFCSCYRNASIPLILTEKVMRYVCTRVVFVFTMTQNLWTADLNKIFTIDKPREKNKVKKLKI